MFSLSNIVLNYFRFNLISLEPKHCGCSEEKWLKSHRAVHLFLCFCGMALSPPSLLKGFADTQCGYSHSFPSIPCEAAETIADGAW